MVHDAFGLVRPDWKFTKDLQEAGAAFAQACRENYSPTTANQAVDTDEQDGDEADMDGELHARKSLEESHETSSNDEAEVRQYSQSAVGSPSDHFTLLLHTS